jgi:DNA (cytosine-5)-methyltransferase 1
MNVLSLFSGIGGLELGLERAGMTTIGQVEIDPYCQRVLARHWPGVPRHDDVRTTVEWWQSEPRPTVDVVAGGFPCQPVSEAGRRNAQEDPRWLWPAMAEVIRSIQPDWVIGENVPGLLTLGIDDVVLDLGRLGYKVRVGAISACAVGAPHMRRRVFVVGHAMRVRCGQGRDNTPASAGQGRGRHAASGSGWWTTEPRMDRVANGVPDRVDRLRSLGNAVVPRVAEYIGRLVMNHATEAAA